MAVTMKSIESFKVHGGGHGNTLTIKTKSGESIKVHHPTDEIGDVVTFDKVAEAILNNFTMWVITESRF